MNEERIPKLVLFYFALQLFKELNKKSHKLYRVQKFSQILGLTIQSTYQAREQYHLVLRRIREMVKEESQTQVTPVICKYFHIEKRFSAVPFSFTTF